MQEVKYRIKNEKNQEITVYETYCTISIDALGFRGENDKSFADLTQFIHKGKKIVVVGDKTKYKIKIKVSKDDIQNAQFLCDYANEAIEKAHKMQRENWETISKKAYSKENSRLLYTVNGEKYRFDFYDNYLLIENNSSFREIFYIDVDNIAFIESTEYKMFNNVIAAKSIKDRAALFGKILERDIEKAKEAVATVRPLIQKIKLGL